MNNQQAYDTWSANYDAVENKTRDLEAEALRASVTGENLDILEIGCGTGKNTEFLITKARKLIGADFSPEMLAKAKEKFREKPVKFRQMDLREDWDFPENAFDLIICSLVLEHIENLDFVFAEARKVLRTGGQFYIGELHPFKQYQGSKARFETGSGVFELECFVHHASDFFASAQKNNFVLAELKEWFDDKDKTQVPRLLTMIFKNEK